MITRKVLPVVPSEVAARPAGDEDSDRRHREDWERIVPDTATRQEWIEAFGLGKHYRATAFHRFFTDPVAARAWDRQGWFGARACGYLHDHGITPEGQSVKAAATAAIVEGGVLRDSDTRACIMLVHPHLTREDRDAIINSGITLVELDHLIATSTYDRTVLATIAALKDPS